MAIKSVSEMSITAQNVAKTIDAKIGDCKEFCKRKQLSAEAMGIIAQAIKNIVNKWEPELNMQTKKEVLGWADMEYGLAL